MSKYTQYLTLCIALLAPWQALAWAPRAQAVRVLNMASTNDYNVLEAVALNASAATRTITTQVGTLGQGGNGDGFAKLLVVIDYTYSAATTVTVLPSCSQDGGSTYGQETSTAIASGAGTVSAYSDTYTTGAASKILRLGYDVSGCTHYKLVFGGASADASDLVDVQLTLFVGE